MNSIDLVALQGRIFKQDEKTKVLTIGGFAIKQDIRELLKEQADTHLRTELFEIIQATIVNEAARLALQSNTIEHTQFAKALHYWNTVVEKLLTTLSQ